MILRGLVKAKATFYLKTDVEGRRQRARKGLDTQVVFAEKYECHRLGYDLLKIFSGLITWSINESVSISPQE